jgi:polysaccharide export outer membrane protein
MTHKKTLMMIDEETTTFEQDSAYSNQFYQQYTLQPGDILSITVKSIDPQTVEVFNKVPTDKLTSVNVTVSPITGYLLNQEGNIEMPILGFVNIANLTLRQAQDKLFDELKKYFQHVTLSIMLGNYQVDVLGYVNTPGRYKVENQAVTILSALAVAGDFQEYANRKRVKLVRQEEGKTKIIILDLQNLDKIEAKYFFILPHDVIYVEPDKSLAVKRNLPWITVTLTSLTLIIAILSNLK